MNIMSFAGGAMIGAGVGLLAAAGAMVAAEVEDARLHRGFGSLLGAFLVAAIILVFAGCAVTAWS